MTCRQCQGPCTRTVPLTNKAPKEVLNLFTDISEQLKSVFKNYNFQESQKRSLLEFKERKAQQMKMMGMEVVERKKVERDRLAQLTDNLASLERREAELKNEFNKFTSQQGNGGRRIEQRGGGLFVQGKQMFGGGIGHLGQVFGEREGGHGLRHEGFGILGCQESFGNQFGSGSRRHSLDRSGGGNDRSRERLNVTSPVQTQARFLEMKTPAVWYHKQKDRPARNSPQQKLMELAAVKRTEGGSRNGGSPFFTNPPTLGGHRLTPNGRR